LRVTGKMALLSSLCPLLGGFPAFSASWRTERQALSMDETLDLRPIRQETRVVPHWTPHEVSFGLRATYTNPFDSEEIDVFAEILTPQGKRLIWPAFFYQEFIPSDQGPLPQGDPCWKVRYSPRSVGRHRFRIVARNQAKEVSSRWHRFRCVPSRERGPIQMNRSNPLYCAFENGEPYFPLGINLFVFSKLGQGIPTDRLDQCLNWMEKLSAHRGNFARLRMDSWWLPIEMSPDDACGYMGLGYYHQRTCWEIDRIYEKGRETGIYLMHCLDNANGNVNASPVSWRRPYNLYLKENGGCCAAPSEFWTSPEAKRQTRNKLRYCVARWGAHPHLMCWEFWNEVACKDNIIRDARDWHEEMASFLRETDLYDHPVTTSLMGNKKLAEEIASLPGLDIVQYHHYSRSEMVPEVAAMTRQVLLDLRKPFFLGEYGVAPDFRPGNCDYDSTGIHMHNGLWTAAFSGGLGAGAMWYVKNYVDSMDLWSHYEALVNFCERVPWNDARLRACALQAPYFLDLPASSHPIDLPLKTSMTYAFKPSPETNFTLERDGQVSNWDSLRPHLYTSSPRKCPPVFNVHAKKPFTFLIHVHCSVGDERNQLLVDLDGKTILRRAFPAGKKHGEQSEYIASYDNWRTSYDEQVSIPIPAGPHQIRCEALGKDRLEVSYLLRGAVTFEESAPVRVFGLRTDGAVFLWFHNKSSCWRNAWDKKNPIPVEGMVAEIRALPEGFYSVHWFDPWTGRFTEKEEGITREGVLSLGLPRIIQDVACIVMQATGHER